MKKETVTTNQITEGVIWKQLLLFFFPIVLGTFFQQLYNTADTIVVGRFVSKEALAAVGGSAAQIVGLIVGFFVGLASGASVIISQFYGAKSRVQLNRALHTAYAFSIIGSIFITVLGILIAPWMLELMHTPQETMADALLYLRIYFAGIIFVFIYNVGSSILRAMGDSRRPLYYLIVCCFLNIVLDIVLVIVFHMGVAGVSIATIFSQGVSAVLITRALMHSDDLYQLEFRKIRFHKAALISLIWVGCPTGIQSVLYSVTNMLIQTFLNNLGTDTVAAWSAFGKIDSLYWMVNNAFGIAVTTFVGQNFGAGKYDRMKKSVRIGLCMGLCTALTLTLIFYNFGTPLFRLFTSDENVIPRCSGILPVRLHRTALRCTPRNRRCCDPDAYHLFRCLPAAYRLALLHRTTRSGSQHHRPQLPGHLGDHGGNVYRLLLLPGKEMAEIFCEKNGLILCR